MGSATDEAAARSGDASIHAGACQDGAIVFQLALPRLAGAISAIATPN